MRLAGFRSLLFGVAALFALGASSGCENPFDPLDKTDKLQGLSYFDFSVTWDRWDSDPEYDGLVFTLDYYNEFGDGLDFHDKPHNVVIELWTQKNQNEGIEDSSDYFVKDVLFFSKTIEYSNSEDSIRIPIESYFETLPEEIFDETSGEAIGFAVVRVFPPQGDPREELVIAYPDITFFKPEVAEDSPNE